LLQTSGLDVLWAGIPLHVCDSMGLCESKGPSARSVAAGRSAAGILVTLLFVVLSVVPVISVASRWKHSLKVVLVVIAANGFGWIIYRASQSKISDVNGSPTEISPALVLSQKYMLRVFGLDCGFVTRSGLEVDANQHMVFDD